MNPEQSQSKAAFWMGLSILSFVTMSVAGRAATAEIHVFQIMEMRSIIGLVLIYPLIRAAGGFKAMATARPWPHVGRNVSHYAGQAAWFFALSMIPLAELIAIEFTVPFWTAILAVLFLGERMTMRKAAAILVGFCGVALIVRPGLSSIEPGHAIMIAGAFAFGISVVLVKSMTRTESVVRIIFWMLVIQSLIGLIPCILVWQTPSSDLWPAILVVSATGTFSHYFQARALSHADATVVMPMDFIRLPLMTLVGWFLYQEGLDTLAIGGAVLILAGNLLGIRRRQRNAPVIDAP